MEKSNTTLKDFSALAGKYNHSKYEGRAGWAKLAYELRSRLECQGLPGAIVNYKITKEDVDTPGAGDDADAARQQHREAQDVLYKLASDFQKQLAKRRRHCKSLASSRRKSRRFRRSRHSDRFFAANNPTSSVGRDRPDRHQGGDVSHQEGDAHRLNGDGPQDGASKHEEGGEEHPEGAAGSGMAHGTQPYASDSQTDGSLDRASGGEGHRGHRERDQDERDLDMDDDETARALEQDVAMHQQDVQDTENEMRRLGKAIKALQEQLAISEQHHVSAATMAKDVKTINTLLHNVRNLEDFLKLDKDTRRALYHKANTTIAMVLTMVLGADYRALLDEIDSEDGMAIWEMLATENEEDCANPIDRKLEEIRAIKQDQQGQHHRNLICQFIESMESSLVNCLAT